MKLTPQQYYVLREKGTERPFSGKYVFNHEDGIYRCAACGNELFSSDHKFDSGSGWPAFDRPIREGAVKTNTDKSGGMIRTEIVCGECESHLGHVFEDGPTETQNRYCVNSLSLDFESPKAIEEAIFAAGCFWGVEENFRKMDGVIATSVGYSGGKTENPTYDDVCSNSTGHIEVVKVEYNPEEVSYEELLDKFFTIHDPTSEDRQGLDVGVQYRSVIFYKNDKQKKIAEEAIEALNKAKVYGKPIVTEIREAEPFYRAEDYHQKYIMKKKTFSRGGFF